MFYGTYVFERNCPYSQEIIIVAFSSDGGGFYFCALFFLAERRALSCDGFCSAHRFGEEILLSECLKWMRHPANVILVRIF